MKAQVLAVSYVVLQCTHLLLDVFWVGVWLFAILITCRTDILPSLRTCLRAFLLLVSLPGIGFRFLFKITNPYTPTCSYHLFPSPLIYFISILPATSLLVDCLPAQGCKLHEGRRFCMLCSQLYSIPRAWNRWWWMNQDLFLQGLMAHSPP